MDAVQKTLKTAVLFLATALLLAVPGWAQTLTASPNSVGLSSPNSGFVQVTITGGSWTISNSSGTFFVYGPSSGNSGDSFTVSIGNTAGCTNQACTGSITVHPTSGAGADLAVPVTFTPGSSGGGGTGGNGTITASPSSITLSTTTNQAASAQVVLSTSSSSTISFSASSNSSWLSVSPTSGSVNASSSLTLTIFGNATNITTSQSGAITVTPSTGSAFQIPVTLNLNGTSTSSYSLSPTSVAFSYPSSTQTQQVVVFNNASLSTYTVQVANCTGGFTWLLANNGTFLTGQPVGSMTLSLSNPANLPTGTYSCSVIVSNPGNSADQVTLPVTLSVNGGNSNSTYSLSPTSVSFAYPNGNTSSQGVTVTNRSSLTTFNLAISNCTNGYNWLLANNTTTSASGQSVSAGIVLQLFNAGSLPSPATYTCSVVVSNPNNSADAITLPVSLTVGGGSSGNYTYSPTSFTFTTSAGVTPNSQSLSVTVPSGVTFTTSFSYNVGQLFLTQPTGSYTNSQSNIPVSVNPGNLAAGTYTNYILLTANGSQFASIPVTLTVGSGGTNGYSASPTSLSFSSSAGGSPFSQSVTISGPNSVVVGFQLNSGVNFITYPTSGSSFNPSTIPVTVSTSGLAAGSYSETMNFTVGGSTVASVAVSLTVGSGGTNGFTVSPTALTFTTTPGTAPNPQSITVTTPSGSSFQTSLQLNSGVNFVSTPATGTFYSGNQILTVTLAPGSLGTGTYSETLSLISGGVTVASIPITLTISSNGGTGGTSSIAAPTSLTFSYQASQGSPPPYQTVSIAPSGSFTATSNQNWISVSPTSGTGPSQLTVTVIPQVFTAGTNTSGQITITTPSGTQNVNVTLSVTSGAVLYANPGSINFSLGSTQSSVFLYASDNSTQSVNVTSQTSWITVSNSGAQSTTPVSYTVTISTSGLCNGLNTGSIVATASGTSNSPLTIPVTVLVTGSSNTNCSTSSGPLTLSPTTLSFTGATGGTQPASQQVSVTAPSSSTTYTISTSILSGSTNWLSVTSPCNNCNWAGTTTLTIAANQTNLASGTYQGTVNLTTNGATQTIPVTFTVGTAGGTGNITVTPTSLTFSAQPGGSAPAGQTVTVSSASGSAGVGYVYSVTTANGSNWLSASVNGTALTNGQGLTTPTTLTVNVNSSVLGASSTAYTGSITLSPNGGTAVTIPVSVTVQANAVSASPATLTFSYQPGSTAPSAQTVTVSGPSGLPFSAQASSSGCGSGNWLAVSPASGTTPGSVSVSLNTGALTAAGTCTGTVTVSGTGSATGTTTISVSLTVTAPLPTITQVSSAASYIGQSISPGEIIAIFGTNLGPTPLVGLALDSTGKVATTVGGVQVLIGGNPAPMIYASGSQVAAVVPYEIAQLKQTTVYVKFLGQTSNVIPVNITPTNPGIFTANASGTGPGAILNSNNSVNSPTNQATKGSAVSIYMTGEGQTNPAGVDGKVTTVNPTPPLTPTPLLPIGVTINGQPANYTFAGEAPGFVSGLLQLNVQIPANASSGDLPLIVTIGGAASQSGVTVSVK